MKITVYVYCGECEDKIVSLKKEDLIPALIAEDEDFSFANWLANEISCDPDDFAEDFVNDPVNTAQDYKEAWHDFLLRELDEILDDARYSCLGDEFFSYDLDLPCGTCPKNIFDLALDQFGGVEGLIKAILS